MVVVGTVTVAFAVVVAPGSVSGLGDTAQVAPAGPPAQFSDSVPEKPFTAATVTVKFAFLPTIVCDEGETAMVKSVTLANTPGEVLALKSTSPP